jgi:hypothetical protein
MLIRRFGEGNKGLVRYGEMASGKSIGKYKTQDTNCKIQLNYQEGHTLRITTIKSQ